ncbi:hypothetical protein P167DRAFT_95330 [Morchella conica CCBAS932]|uniref:Uncharacterized protein n=1 Tax=Morchella conica CCBAS932 TaxID=1392247 RepID=A0A3N4KTD1_9PEZI|nr:hypothetical protein P167DRAFT_95330 [Morchella conica CCBAS932]
MASIYIRSIHASNSDLANFFELWRYMKYKSPVIPSVERVRISCDISRISLPTDHDLDLNCKVLIGKGSFFAPLLVRFFALQTSRNMDFVGNLCIGFEFARGRRTVDMCCVFHS